MSEDRDGKIASLVALLEPAIYPIDDYIAALDAAGGDVGSAAERLLLGDVGASKRKADASLSSWLGQKVAKRKPTRTFTNEDEGPSLAGGQVWTPVDRKTKTVPVDTKGTPAPDKTVRDAFELMRSSASTSSAKPGRSAPLPVLRLANQAAIDAHALPLTLLPSPLPAPLASALFLLMMHESEKWPQHKWYLAGKWVEAPHLATGYAMRGGGYGQKEGGEEVAYWYSGMPLPKVPEYPALLHKAAELIEEAVDGSLEQRARHPLEWRGRWRANVCGVNRYLGAKSGVGWHADQMSYLGPYTTIASLSLGTTRAFRVRPTAAVDGSLAVPDLPIRTYEITLEHNSLCIMNAGCQERFKHTIPPQKAIDLFRPAWDMDQNPTLSDNQPTHTNRINITFRFYREDFHPAAGLNWRGEERMGTPVCKCGIPALLRADQKGKARLNMLRSPKKARPQQHSSAGPRALQDADGDEDQYQVLDDDMVFFWQCQSPGQTGDLKGCGFFKILDVKGEGRGPCMMDR